MSKFLLGGMMGLAMGVGAMMTPIGRSIRRDVHHGIHAFRRWMRTL